MSSFLCSNLHTAIIALAASRSGLTKQSPKALMSAFRSMNNAALAVRYGDAPERMSNVPNNVIRANRYLAECTDSDLAQLFTCFKYQCSEGDVLETHKAAKLFNKVNEHFFALDTGDSNEWSI